jgi:hypothetical protein
MSLYCIYWLVLMDARCDSKYNQQDAMLYNILYYCKCSTCFRRFFRPSSGAQKLYTQHQVCVKLVRPRIQPDHAATEQLKIYLWWNCWNSSSQGSWASVVTGLWVRQYRVWIWQGWEIFLILNTPRPALGPTRPPVQWVLRLSVCFRLVKGPGHGVDRSPRSSA